MERWKSIPGFDDRFLASDQGNIMSVNYHNYGRQRLLKKSLNRCGYEVVCLFYRGKAYSCLVHRLVAMAFLENPNGLPVINHLNEIKTDNRVENLCWSSIKDNVNYGTRTARMVATLGTPIVQISKDGNVIASFESIIDAGRKTGIDHSAINKCVNGRRKSAGGFIWRSTKQTD